MELGQLYFFTATITNWRKLLAPDKYKDLIVDSLRFLVQRGKIAVYGFVIMPNHIHLIWEMLELNGKELPHASFMKYTGHRLQKDLRLYHPLVLEQFRVENSTRQYQFWQRDALPVWLYSPHIIHQKLDYIHHNPCQGKWLLAEEPALYQYSSARFYENGVDEFGMLRHIGEKV